MRIIAPCKQMPTRGSIGSLTCMPIGLFAMHEYHNQSMHAMTKRTKQSVRLLLALGTPASCSHSRARVLVAQSSLPMANRTCSTAHT